MSSGICSCDEPTFGNLNRPSCVIEQGVLKGLVLIPRTGSDGTRNTFDPSSPTFGADLLAKVNAPDPQDRVYPLQKIRNASFPRTDTAYDTDAAGEKFKLDGTGGVRSWLFELWGKDAVAQIFRELKKYGCSEIDAFYIDAAGAIWGIKDDINGIVFRGYAVSEQTFDAFKMYATDTTIAKLNVSFDLEQSECEENSYGVTSEELGYAATTLEGLITGFATVTDPVDGTAAMTAFTGFGTAGNRNAILGMDTIAPPVVISLFNVTQGLAMTAGTSLAAVVGSDGDYTFDYLTAEAALNDVIRVTITGVTGHDMQVTTFTHAF